MYGGCAWLSPPTKQTDNRRAKIYDHEVGPVEQAAFGTGIRRASHRATTPVGFLPAFWGRQSIRRYGIGGVRWYAHQGVQTVSLLGKGVEGIG